MKFLTRFLACTTLAIAGMASHQTANAQFPSKPIKLVLPGSPGGGTDVLARFYAKEMSDLLGQPMVVEYKPGGGTSIGTDYVSRSEPDGHTLLIGASSIGALQIFRKTALNPETELTPVSILADLPLALVSPTAAPWKTFQEMVAYARANPGKLSYAHQGSGTTILYPEQLKHQFKLNIVGVAYKSGGELALALMKNEVQLGFANVARAMEDEKGSKVRILAVSGDKRRPELPQIPTMAELGLSNMGHTWIAVFGPKGMPRDIQARLEDASAKAIAAVRQGSKIPSDFILVGSNAAELRDMMRKQIQGWTETTKAAGIRPE